MHTFRPSEFYWKQLSRSRVKVDKACKVLNTLTDEQKEAVLFYTRGQAQEEADNERDSDSGHFI